MDAFISIPVQGTDEQVLVSTSELPAEPEDLLELLKGEFAPLNVWLDFAKAYLAAGQVDSFLHIVKVACGPEVEQYFAESKFERLQIHCAAAAYQMSLAKAAKERESKQKALTQATVHLNKAITIDYNEQLPILGLGQVALIKGDIAGAKAHFEKASQMYCNAKPNISGLLALADLTFHQEEYRGALTLYRKALKQHPNAPAEVRLGIAACNFRLGSFSKAKSAYERVLQLDGNCCEALLGLAVLSFNAPDADRGLREGMQMLCRAYNSNPLHPGVLNLLAHFSLLRGELEKAKILASTAYEAANTESAKAISICILARTYHSAGNIQEAFRYYSQASKLNPKAALPLLGLAQINLLQKENTNAITLLETALQHNPGWNEALMILGNLYPQMESRKGQTAVDHFKQAADKSTSNGQVLEMLAELLATIDPAGSLKAYKKSIELYQKERAARLKAREKAQKRGKTRSERENLEAQAADAGALAMDRVLDDSQPSQAANELAVAAALGNLGDLNEDQPDDLRETEDDSLSARLLNNAAALHLRGGEKEVALNLVEEAVQAAKIPGSAGLAPANQITLGFNLARIKEENGRLTEAGKEYKEILENFPNYLDCYFRLAMIARAQGDYNKAFEWAHKALDLKQGVQGKDANALALTGFLHIERREWKEAEDTFNELQQETSKKNDVYAMLAKAIIPLNSLYNSKRKEDPEKVKKLLSISKDAFRKILETKDPNNVYAAHGMGAVLAEQATRRPLPSTDHLIHVKKAFEKVKDAVASLDPWIQMPDLQENLGHLALAEGRYKDALQFYSLAQRRFYNGTSVEMHLFSARALVDEDSRRTENSRKTKTIDKPSLLPEARLELVRALRLDPSNPVIKFNLAYVSQQTAIGLLIKVRPEQDPNKAEEFEKAVKDLALAHRTFSHLRHQNMKGVRTGLEDAKLDQHIGFCMEMHTEASKDLQKAAKERAMLDARRHQSKIELEAAIQERKAREEALKRKKARQEAERDEQARRAQMRLQDLKASWADNKVQSDAVAEGDAMKADKRRKKRRREDEVDAIFGNSDSDDGGDYNPEAPEEVEYIEPGGDAEVEEPEYKENDEEGGGLNRSQNPLAGTGLESSDDDQDISPGKANGSTPNPPSSKGRLKRNREGTPEQNTQIADVFGDSDDERPNIENGNLDNENDEQPKQRRKVDLFGDSDED